MNTADYRYDIIMRQSVLMRYRRVCPVCASNNYVEEVRGNIECSQCKATFVSSRTDRYEDTDYVKEIYDYIPADIE